MQILIVISISIFWNDFCSSPCGHSNYRTTESLPPFASYPRRWLVSSNIPYAKLPVHLNAISASPLITKTPLNLPYITPSWIRPVPHCKLTLLSHIKVRRTSSFVDFDILMALSGLACLHYSSTNMMLQEISSERLQIQCRLTSQRTTL